MTDPNRIYISPVATYSATPPAIGIDEYHPIENERQLMFQWIANNLAYQYARSSSISHVANADGFSEAGGTSSRALTLTGSNCTITGAADGGKVTLGATNTRELQWAGSTITITGNADGGQINAGLASPRLLSWTGGAIAFTAPVAGIAVNLAGNLTTTTGAVAIAAPAAGTTITCAADVEFSGAFKPTFASSAAATHTLPAVSGILLQTILTTTAAPNFVANDSVIAPVSGTHYTIPATGAASTVTITDGAPAGTWCIFSANGVLNGHTVQYRGSTGSLNLTAALTASKRHVCVAISNGTVWSAFAVASP